MKVGVLEPGFSPKYSGLGVAAVVVSRVTWRWIYGWAGIKEDRSAGREMREVW
jgi:hypothetical protein